MLLHTDRIDLHVHHIPLPAAGGFADIVTAPSETVVRFIADLLPAGDTEEKAAAILVTAPLPNTPETVALQEAAFEAIRGIIGALTLECAGRLRINLVRAASVECADSTLDFLRSADAGFVAGATFDLTGEFA
jgi:hypothetical protein